MNKESQGFNHNYKVLKDISESLRQQENTEAPNIDDLIPMVEKATEAYKACKVRLEAVEKALAELEANSDSESEDSSSGSSEEKLPF